MNELKVTGKIISISELKEGTTAKGDPYKAMSFAVDTSTDYDNLYSFELFQFADKENVDNFLKYNKIGDTVKVKFNIKTNKSKEGEVYYTKLSAWSVFTQTEEEALEEDDLPF